MKRLAVESRLALSVALVGGGLFGCREALLALQANAFVQPQQYFFVYLAVPVLAWMVLAIALLLPGAVLMAAGARPDPRRSFVVYMSVLVFAGTLAAALSWAAAIATRLQSVGAHVGSGMQLAVWGLALILAGSGALIAGAAAAWYAGRVQRPLRFASRVAVVAAVVSWWPVARFVAGDWKWNVPGGESAPATTGGPNLVLISIDTLRADHLGAYGDPHGLTPHLDGLAAGGVVFRDTVTPSPWTLPAMASVLTGLYPRYHGAGRITNRRDPLGRSALPAGSWTLATALRARGYRTHAIVTNPYLALRYGLGQGFETYENVTIESEAFLAFGQTTAVRLFTWLWPNAGLGDRGATVSAHAVRWLARARAARPFFLWLHYIDPHAPYSRPGVTRHKSFRGDTLFAPQATAALRRGLTAPDIVRLRSGEIRLGPAEKDAVRDLYRGEVARVDAAVGEVLAALDRDARRDHTLVICVADHGEEFWEHGGVEHGHTVYEEVLRVPWIMRWPGHLPRGRRVRNVVRLVDLAPTVLDLLGLPPAARSDGRSTVPLIKGNEDPPRVALAENLLFAEERIGLRLGRHKYILWENGKEEVYDLADDPGERRDLAGVDAAVRPLRMLYAALTQAQLQPARAGEPQALAAGPDPRTVAALRALGYLH
ncbi:MAG: sulfatase [Candidatus Binatia bacterium]